jgi:hypothetical protein
MPCQPISAHNLYNRIGVTYCQTAITGTRIKAANSIAGVVAKTWVAFQKCRPSGEQTSCPPLSPRGDAVFAPIETLKWRDIGIVESRRWNGDMAAEVAPALERSDRCRGRSLPGYVRSAVAREDQELTSNPASCGSPAFASAAAGRPMPVYEKPFR